MRTGGRNEVIWFTSPRPQALISPIWPSPYQFTVLSKFRKQVGILISVMNLIMVMDLNAPEGGWDYTKQQQ